MMRILCFGDSNTYGYDPRSFFGERYPAGDRWVDLLAKYTGCEVINAGVNGRMIPSGAQGLRLLREYEDVDIVLVMLGTNDLLQGASATDAASRMDAFLEQAVPCFKRILLVVPPPMKRGAWVPTEALVQESVRLAQAYRQLARERSIPFVDTHSWNIGLAFDGVHFTEAGHHTFASRLIESLESL